MNRPYRTTIFFLSLFLFIAVFRSSPLFVSVDRAIYTQALSLSYSKTWIVFWEAVAFCAQGKLVYTLVAMHLLRLIYQTRPKNVFPWLLLIALLCAANPLVKELFQFPRPVSLSPYSDLQTYSFPSGHAFNSAVLFVFLPTLLQKKIPALFVVLGMLLVGASRVFLGAHWVTDVIGGWIFGLICSDFLSFATKAMLHPRRCKNQPH